LAGDPLDADGNVVDEVVAVLVGDVAEVGAFDDDLGADQGLAGLTVGDRADHLARRLPER
jgi:hypothetical protein